MYVSYDVAFMQIITYDMYRESKVLQDVDVPQAMAPFGHPGTAPRPKSISERKKKHRTGGEIVDSEQHMIENRWKCYERLLGGMHQ